MYRSRFETTAKNGVERLDQRLKGLDRVLSSLGYEATLKRGYAVVRDDLGHVLTTAQGAEKAKELEIQFQDGKVKR